jgi:phosphatidylethanolamine-binding protein (PEBP) family uncharacterized protein
MRRAPLARTVGLLLAGVLALAAGCATDKGRTLDPPTDEVVATVSSGATQVLEDGKLVDAAQTGPGGFWVDSPMVAAGTPMPYAYTAPGGATSPPIRWGLVPEGTVEVALVLEDTTDDSALWIVGGLDPALEGLSEGSTPPNAVTYLAVYPEARYFGPDAPVGETRTYRFTLYALPQPLALDPQLPSAEVVAAIEAAATGEASFAVTMTGL